MNNYRLYSIVAGNYLSGLQKGLQTAHVVSEMFNTVASEEQAKIYADWAQDDKTIIILNGGSSGGVIRAYDTMKVYGDKLGLPTTIFYEDEESLGGCATAMGIIVPPKYHTTVYDAYLEVWYHPLEDNPRTGVDVWALDSVEGQFINALKSFKLA